MFQQNQDFGENPRAQTDKRMASMLAVETLRSAGKRSPAVTPTPRKEKISLFLQVFGGTMVSLVGLGIITAYTQITTTETDLRRDINQIQSDLVRKEEFNTRLMVLWSSIKELQASNASLMSLNEHAKHLDQSVSAQGKTSEEQYLEMQRKHDQINQRLQSLAERLAVIEVVEHGEGQGTVHHLPRR